MRFLHIHYVFFADVFNAETPGNCPAAELVEVDFACEVCVYFVEGLAKVFDFCAPFFEDFLRLGKFAEG